MSRERLERTRDLMNEHILDSLVIGYEKLIPTLVLPDENDRHVLAAAIHSRANVIVTFNLKDFPASALSKYSIRAQHPDEFVLNLLSLDADTLCSTIRKQRLDLKNPPKTVEDLLSTFEAQGLTKSVSKLRVLSEKL